MSISKQAKSFPMGRACLGHGLLAAGLLVTSAVNASEVIIQPGWVKVGITGADAHTWIMDGGNSVYDAAKRNSSYDEGKTNFTVNLNNGNVPVVFDLHPSGPNGDLLGLEFFNIRVNNNLATPVKQLRMTLGNMLEPIAIFPDTAITDGGHGTGSISSIDLNPQPPGITEIFDIFFSSSDLWSDVGYVLLADTTTGVWQNNADDADWSFRVEVVDPAPVTTPIPGAVWLLGSGLIGLLGLGRKRNLA